MNFVEGQGILGKIRFTDWGNLQILNSGRTLDDAELARIKAKL